MVLYLLLAVLTLNSYIFNCNETLNFFFENSRNYIFLAPEFSGEMMGTLLQLNKYLLVDTVYLLIQIIRLMCTTLNNIPTHRQRSKQLEKRVDASIQS